MGFIPFLLRRAYVHLIAKNSRRLERKLFTRSPLFIFKKQNVARLEPDPDAKIEKNGVGPIIGHCVISSL